MKKIYLSFLFLGLIAGSGFSLAASEDCESTGVAIQENATPEQCMSACIATLRDACDGNETYQRCDNICSQGEDTAGLADELKGIGQ